MPPFLLQPGERLRWVLRSHGADDDDLRSLPLIARKQKLETMLRRHDHPYVRYSEPFKNAAQLLIECRQRRLEGIVSKKKQAPYKSGKCDRIKVKCTQWKEENKKSGRVVCPLINRSSCGR